MDDSKKTALIGIDFGATYSKVAVYMASNSAPTGTECRFRNQFKTPTVLTINPGSDKLELATTETAEELTGTGGLKFFKLALMGGDPYSDKICDPALRSLIRKHSTKMELPKGKKTSDLVSDFLRGLWDKIFNGHVPLIRNDGSCHLRLHVAISFPACWTESTRGRLRIAVQEAGIASQANRLSFFTEHDAAVRGMRPYLQRNFPEVIATGNSVIVVDGGGISIDAAVYRYQALSAGGCPGHVVQNDSKLYGSLSMDAAVDTLISRHIRQATEHLPSNIPPTALQLDLEEIALIMWSRYKRRGFCFDGMFQGGLAFNDSDNKVRIEIHRDDMIVLVHNIIDHVTELISGLYEAAVKTHEAAPKGVFLTGGLFQSDYIRNEVCNKLPRILGDNGLRVMAPDGDVWWSTVCRGAALCMLPDE